MCNFYNIHLVGGLEVIRGLRGASQPLRSLKIDSKTGLEVRIQPTQTFKASGEPHNQSEASKLAGKQDLKSEYNQY